MRTAATLTGIDVLAGIDVLRRGGWNELRGKRVGLVTNHTGRLASGQATADALHQAPGVTLTALFGPEHGIRGTFDQPHVDDAVDDATGVPVYSLYGARHAPTESQLQNIDILIFDIQDIGCRFYTYLSTLGHVLEAANDFGLPVLVLDRPNPITGLVTEGPLPDGDKLSFTAYHSLPVRHGLTVGEAARLLHYEKALTNSLTVIPCEGWRRGNWYDATGLLWVNPSPNMRCLTQAMLYPGIGLLEMTNVSVGRGTDTPFEIVGAPWLNGRALASQINARALPGVRGIPIEFTPQASVHAGVLCNGVNLIITNRQEFNAVRLGISLALALRELHPAEWDMAKFITLLANQSVFDGVRDGQDYAALASGWTEELAQFMVRREPHLLYE